MWYFCIKEIRSGYWVTSTTLQSNFRHYFSFSTEHFIAKRLTPTQLSILNPMGRELELKNCSTNFICASLAGFNFCVCRWGTIWTLGNVNPSLASGFVETCSTNLHLNEQLLQQIRYHNARTRFILVFSGLEEGWNVPKAIAKHSNSLSIQWTFDLRGEL